MEVEHAHNVFFGLVTAHNAKHKNKSNPYKGT